jgi:hypothetical protein
MLSLYGSKAMRAVAVDAQKIAVFTKISRSVEEVQRELVHPRQTDSIMDEVKGLGWARSRLT